MKQFIKFGLKDLLILCMISTFALAYTTIPSGNVSGVKTAGTYYVEGNIYVLDGSTLTLDAGVILKFAEGAKLLVQGTLDANGSSENQVYFTSVNDNSIGETISGSSGDPQPGDWIGTSIWEVAYFDYSIFRYGGGGGVNGFYSNLQYDTGEGNVNNCTIENSLTHGLYVLNASPEISGNTLRDNGSSVDYHGLYTNNCSADITNNTFTDNAGLGAYISNGTAATYSGNTGSGNGTDAFAAANLNVSSNLSWSASDTFPIRMYLPSGGMAHSVTVNEGNTLTFSSGTFQIDHTVSINGSGNFTLSAGATLELKGIVEYEFTNGINDQLTLSGTITLDPGANYIFSGSSAQVSGSEFPSAVNDLTINNSAGVTLSSNVTAGGTLNLTQGNLTTSSNIITIGSSASSTGSISRTTGTVIGNLQRWIAASETSDILFPVGTADNYCPVNLSYTSAPSAGGTLLSQFTGSDPGTNGVDLSSDPVQDGSFLIDTCYSDGYWTLTSGNGLSGGNYSLDVTAEGFSDISDYTSLHLLKRANASSNWSVDGIHSTATGSNDIPVLHRSGLSGFSEFALGDGETMPPILLTATSGTTSASYNTLRETFDAINAGIHTGDISILIGSDVTETLTPNLYASGSGDASYTSVLIRPATAGVTISGAVAYLVHLYGADNVTIDGQVGGNSGTKDLTLHNTSAAAHANKTLYLENDACNNTVQYVIMRGEAPSGSSTSIGSGLVHFGNGSVTGNSNNTIDHCDIDGQGNTCACIYSYNSNGTPYNNGNTVSNCNIYDFFVATQRYQAGIYLPSWGNGSWTITGNSFYQTSARSFGTGDYITMYGIYFDTYSACTISHNYIGGSEPECGGTAWTHSAGGGAFMGIYVYDASTSETSAIDGNTISNFYIYHSKENYTIFTGIVVSGGKVTIGTNTGNTIGSPLSNNVITLSATWNAYARGISYNTGDAPATIRNNTVAGFRLNYTGEFHGIYNSSSNAGTHVISDNLIGSLTQSGSILSVNNSINIFGITSRAGGGTSTVSNNTVANLEYASISEYSKIRGIYLNDRGGTVSGNTIRDLSLSAGSTSSGDNNALSGIYAVYTYNPNNVSISDNTIYSLSNTHELIAVETNGIYYKNTGTGCMIGRNHIYDIEHATTNTASAINGIRLASGTVTVANNMISLGTGTGNALNISGISDASSSANTICFNSVRISGTVTGTAGSTFSQAFARSVAAADDIRSNIFANMRSNDGSTQKHYAVNLNSNESLTQNYNLLYAGGSGYIGTANGGTDSYAALGDWQTAASLDAQSLSGDPLFHTLNDLHVLPPSPASNMGQTVSGIETDFYGNSRDESTPDAGAVEFTGRVATNSGSQSDPVAETENTVISTDGEGGVTFNPAASINGNVSGYYFSSGRSGSLPDGLTSMSPYYWAMSTDAEAFTGTLRLYFDKISGNGVGSPETLQLLRRDNENGTWEIHTDVTRNAAYIQANGLTGFSEFALGGSGVENALPIELACFDAGYRDGVVKLNWQTASETNNANFLIYRNDEIIGSAEGAGTTSEPHNYEHIDDQVIPGTTYTYVLADVSYANVETKYINKAVTITIPENDIPQEFALGNNYPNPFNPLTAISYSISAEATTDRQLSVNLSIFNMNGEKVATLVNETQSAGYYNINWNASGFSSGIYFYRLITGDYVETKKMVLMK